MQGGISRKPPPPVRRWWFTCVSHLFLAEFCLAHTEKMRTCVPAALEGVGLRQGGLLRAPQGVRRVPGHRPLRLPRHGLPGELLHHRRAPAGFARGGPRERALLHGPERDPHPGDGRGQPPDGAGDHGAPRGHPRRLRRPGRGCGTLTRASAPGHAAARRRAPAAETDGWALLTVTFRARLRSPF